MTRFGSRLEKAESKMGIKEPVTYRVYWGPTQPCPIKHTINGKGFAIGYKLRPTDILRDKVAGKILPHPERQLMATVVI